MFSDLHPWMARQGGAFTARQAAECGVSYEELAARLRDGDLVVVRRGVYTAAVLWNAGDAAERHRIQVAAALLARGWIPGLPTHLAAAFESARTLWRLPGLHLTGPVVHGLVVPERIRNGGVDLVSTTRRQRASKAGVDVHPAQLPEDQIAYFCGVPCTSLARTAIDLARDGPWWDAVIVGDAARRAGVSQDELSRVADCCALWPGGRQGIRAAEFANPAAESPLESIIRAVCADHGLPTPELQAAVRGACGRMFDLDLFFRAMNTALEGDGRAKYTADGRDPASAHWEEKLREDSIRETGIQFVRITYAQITQRPEEVVARIKAAFTRSQRRPA